jgi:septum formation protein
MTLKALKQLSRRRPLVLGSASPRRVHLLREAGIEFRQVVSDVVEKRRPGEDPFAFGLRLAAEKAIEVARSCNDHEVVLGGDTVVVLGDMLLDKPVDRDDAVRILTTLSGHRHTVATSLALADSTGLLIAGIEKTDVFFNPVTAKQIAEYIDSGEPMDKAGAYGIQGMGAFLVDRIDGNIDNVVGLPLTLLNRLARDILSRL